MHSHSVYLNMIYVDANGPLTRFNWLFKLKGEKLVLLRFCALFLSSFISFFHSFFKALCRKSIYRIPFLWFLRALVPIFLRFGSFPSLFV